MLPTGRKVVVRTKIEKIFHSSSHTNYSFTLLSPKLTHTNFIILLLTTHYYLLTNVKKKKIYFSILTYLNIFKLNFSPSFFKKQIKVNYFKFLIFLFVLLLLLLLLSSLQIQTINSNKYDFS